jgi:hypothetical protein
MVEEAIAWLSWRIGLRALSKGEEINRLANGLPEMARHSGSPYIQKDSCQAANIKTLLCWKDKGNGFTNQP